MLSRYHVRVCCLVTGSIHAPPPSCFFKQFRNGYYGYYGNMKYGRLQYFLKEGAKALHPLRNPPSFPNHVKILPRCYFGHSIVTPLGYVSELGARPSMNRFAPLEHSLGHLLSEPRVIQRISFERGRGHPPRHLQESTDRKLGLVMTGWLMATAG